MNAFAVLLLVGVAAAAPTQLYTFHDAPIPSSIYSARIPIDSALFSESLGRWPIVAHEPIAVTVHDDAAPLLVRSVPSDLAFSPLSIRAGPAPARLVDHHEHLVRVARSPDDQSCYFRPHFCE